MARSAGGRIIVEVDPALKRRLYAALSLDGSTLKDWFVKEVEKYLEEHLALPPEDPAERRRGGG